MAYEHIKTIKYLDHLTKNTSFLLLIPIVLAVCIFYQTFSFSPTNWDDEEIIYKNPCLQKVSVENITNILIPGKVLGEQLYIHIPFTYMSYLLESGTFGLKSSVIHFDNLMLHLANICLVYLFIFLLLRNRNAALIACTLFAVHPLQVEAVAWSMGRKDLLMTMFSLLCLLSFSNFINTKSKKSYIFSLILFFAAVFSKPSAFVLPLILPVLNWYFNGKNDKAFLMRLLPFFVITAVVCLINSKLGISGLGNEMKFVLFRVAFIPAVAEEWFSRLLLLREPLAYYSWYDYYDGSCISITGLILLVSVLVVAGYAFHREFKTIFLGISFLVVMSIPAALLVSWTFRDFITADRYGYLPLLGAFLLASASFLISDKKLFKVSFGSAISLFIIFASWHSYRQAGVWQNSETLWKSLLKAHPDSYIANYNLGNYYYKEKYDLKSAEFHYRRANYAIPDSDVWYNIGIICEFTDRKSESDLCYGRSVALNPNSRYALKKLALSCYRKKDYESALKHFLKITEVEPESPDAYFYCGKIFEMKGQGEMAAEAFRCFEKLKKQGQ